MTFRELLADYYHLQPEERLTVEQRAGLLADGFIYFQVESSQLETILMEQTVLAYYLLDNGYTHTAIPIQNMQEEWFTLYHNKGYLVYRLAERNMDKGSPGKKLAMFHQIGSLYGFEPQSISSYGSWKKLWVEKVNLFEEMIEERFKQRTLSPLILDIFPYIIGMSENAIQYLRETEESESRFFEVDQGSITFRRYTDQLNAEVIWPDELCYDHPARDLTEFIRIGFLNDQSDERMIEFIRDYESIRPLSFFTWRLIYARLIFPIHLYDMVEQVLVSEESGEDVIGEFIERQTVYEERLKDFYHTFGIAKEREGLLELDWLS